MDSLAKALGLSVNGACGRMGREVLALAAQAPDIEVVSAWDRMENPSTGRADPFTGTQITVQGEGPVGDVIVDFSTRDALIELCVRLGPLPCALVSGTTGLDRKALSSISTFAKRHAVLHSANMSTGIAVMHELLRTASRLLDPGWDVEMLEMHHRRKTDAPSGTALSLATTLKSVWMEKLEPVYGRQGLRGPRPRGEMGILALRGGDVVGEHEVILAGTGEVLRIRHDALSRSVFAAGALKAARFLAKAAPGMYTMDDVLGLGR